MVDMKELGKNIRATRKMKGLTQEELAKKADLSTMSIRRYEAGERVITESTLQRIAAALNVDWLELVPEGQRAGIVIELIRKKLRDDSFSADALSEVPEEYRGAVIAADVIKRAGLTVLDTDGNVTTQDGHAVETNSALSTLEELQKGGSKWRKLTPVEAYQMGFPGFNSELDRIKWIYDFLLNNSGKASVFFFLVANLNEEQVRLTLDYLERLIRIPHFQKSSEQKKEPSGEGNP